MRQIILILILAFQAFSVIRTWSSAGSTDGNLVANYDGSGDLLTTDTIQLNNTSVINWTLTAGIKVSRIQSISTYTGAMDFAGYACTTQTGLSLQHNGNANYQTSRFVNYGNVTFANITPFVGTASMSIRGNSTVTMNGKSWYYLSVDSAGVTTTFADTTRLTDDFVVTAGSTTRSGGILICGGDDIRDGVGTHNYGSGVQMAGNNATLHVGSTLTVTASNAVITWAGTGGVWDDDKGLTIAGYIHGDGAGLTSSGANNTNIKAANLPITFVNGGTLVLNSTWLPQLTGSGSFASITGSPAISGTSSLGFRVFTSAVTCTIPAISTTCPMSVSLIGNNIINVIVNQTGNISSSTNAIYSQGTNGSLTYNTNGYSITTTGNYSEGTASASASFTINHGGSSHSIGGSRVALTTGSVNTINLGSSIWSVAGDWTNGSNHTVVPGTSTVNFTGTGASSLTSAGKTLYDVSVVKTGAGTFTNADTLRARNLNVDDGKYTITQPVILSGHFDATTDDSLKCIVRSTVTMTADNKRFGLSNQTGVIKLDSLTLITQGSDSLVLPDRLNIYTFDPAAGKTVWFSAGDTLGLGTIAAGTWNGTAGNYVRFLSDSARAFYYIVKPADTTNVSYFNPRDMKILTGWLRADSTCLSGGGNGNIIFPAPRIQ